MFLTRLIGFLPISCLHPLNCTKQAKAQAENHLPPNTHQPPPVHPGPVDPMIQQLIQQIGGIQNLPTPSQPNRNPQMPPVTHPPPQNDNPIKSLLRQLNVNANGHPQGHPIESVWPQPPPQMHSQFATQNWLGQVSFDRDFLSADSKLECV